MASANGTTISIRKYFCTDCGVVFDSAQSLEVHREYHQENLIMKWTNNTGVAMQNNPIQRLSPHHLPHQSTHLVPPPTLNGVDETNNNTSIKREFPNSVQGDIDSKLVNKSPDSGHNSTTDVSLNSGHPPTPQSFHSASSPYESHEANFSPGYHGFQVKEEYQNYNSQYVDSTYWQEGQYPGADVRQNYRFHPYPHPNFENFQNHTPPPTSKHCDKCTYVCETEVQLLDHIRIAHPITPFGPGGMPNNFQFGLDQQKVKEEPQAEILDLDSQKVHVYQTPEEQEAQLKQQAELAQAMNGGSNGHPHTVSSMLGQWPPNQSKFMQPHPTQMYMAEQNSNYEAPMQPYRPFEQPPQMPQHQPPISNSPSVISSNQVSTTPVVTQAVSGKGSNWKSNEARRPKTYNCSACNKWFTSSGHLKRHYNTTLHKNAVKTSGHPDPATLPISVHHHPTRDPNHHSHRQSKSHPQPSHENSHSPPQNNSSDDTNPGSDTFDNRLNAGLIQQPPSGPYDRHPPNIIGGPPIHHSPSNLSSSSPPNGEAGPSANNDLSRGLQTLPHMQQINMNHQLPPFNVLNQQQISPHHMIGGINHTSTPQISPMYPTTMGPTSMAHQSITNYPNELSPHVTQHMVLTSNNQQELTNLSTGDYHQFNIICANLQETGPLPSFSQFMQAQCNVGGSNSVTDSDLNLHYETEDDDLYNQEYILSDVLPPDQIDIHKEQTEQFQIKEEQFHIKQEQFNIKQEQYEEFHIKQEQFHEEPQPSDLVVILENRLLASPDENSFRSLNSPTITSTAKTPPAKKAKKIPKSELNNNNNNIIKQAFKCHECDKRFNKACYLTQHNKTFHCGDKPFKCTVCGKRFGDHLTHSTHELKHAGDKPHKCDQCPKAFNHKTDLRRHMCLHSGYKPYSCDKCGKGFIRKDHMMKHVETHDRKLKGQRI